MIHAFFTLFWRDVRLALRQGTDVVMVLAFFIMAATLFPLAVGSDLVMLGHLAPGIVWVLALLSVMLSLDRLFHDDGQDGSLELLVLGPLPLPLVALAKTLAHWLLTGLPVTLLAPIIALMLNMAERAVPVLMLSLLLGTPTLSLVGAAGAALTLGTRRTGLLSALLVLPLYVPVLVFGVFSVDAVLNGFSSQPHLLLLAALLTSALPLLPWATAAAIRQAIE